MIDANRLERIKRKYGTSQQLHKLIEDVLFTSELDDNAKDAQAVAISRMVSDDFQALLAHIDAQQAVIDAAREVVEVASEYPEAAAYLVETFTFRGLRDALEGEE